MEIQRRSKEVAFQLRHEGADQAKRERKSILGRGNRPREVLKVGGSLTCPKKKKKKQARVARGFGLRKRQQERKLRRITLRFDGCAQNIP